MLILARMSEASIAELHAEFMTESDIQEPSENTPPAPRYAVCRWLFITLLGVIYLIAFSSIFTQFDGLIGSSGILPAHEFLSTMRGQTHLPDFMVLPTLAWISDSDVFLKSLVALGMVSALCVVLDVLTGPALLLCYVLYLSMIMVGQDFLSFQWDWLLLETGFLAIFFAAWSPLGAVWKRSAGKKYQPPSLVLIWLLRCLLFKLMFMSGMCKLASGDPTWANLTALDYHYLSQPLPTPVAWLVAKLPAWFHKVSTGGTFVIELLVPFAIFGGRKGRIAAAAFFTLLQVIIATTGNYTFFNLLTVTLCILLLDDAIVSKIIPRQLILRIEQAQEKTLNFGSKIISRAVAGLIILITLCDTSGVATSPTAQGWLARLAMRCGIVNQYGLFAVMTTSRKEIIVEGSNDMVTWLPYEFRYKPGDLKQPPCVVEPFQPRLDWQMWFAALGSLENSPWFTNFVTRLLEGKPAVLALLKTNPFPGEPPKWIRARLYDYKFSSFAELQSHGLWWTREPAGDFMPECSLVKGINAPIESPALPILDRVVPSSNPSQDTRN